MAEIVCRVIDCHVFRRVQPEPVYLVLRRAPKTIYAGSWRMVGGKISAGEKAFETAIRELREETGLTPARFWTVNFVNSFYEAAHDRINVIPVFAAEVVSDAVRLSGEHDECAWLPFDEAVKRLEWPAQKEGLRMIHDYIIPGKAVAGFMEIRL